MADRTSIDRLAQVWGSTAELCRGFTAEQWGLPTDCPGWSVKDNVSHLIGTESMLLGRPSPSPAPPGLAHVRSPMGEMNEAWVSARRPQPGPEVLAEFEDVTAKRLAGLRAMTDDQLEAETPSPIGKVPYSTFMDVRVMDCWVHEQDIRRATARPGGLDSDAAEAAVRRLTSTFGYVVGKRAGAPDGSSVVLDLTGPLGRTTAVALSGGRAAAVDPPSEPTVCLTMSGETFVCLATGRREGAEALDTGEVSMRGDANLGRRVVTNLATMP